MSSVQRLTVSLLAITLAGCGGSTGSGNATADAAGTTERAVGQPAIRQVAVSDPAIAGWKARDACALVPQDKVAALLGPIKRFDLAADPGDDPETSTCTIVLRDHRELRLSAYKSAHGADADARKLQRSFAGAASTDPVDVAGLGEEAFWSTEPRDLWVFLDSARSFEVKVDGKPVPDDASAKAAAIALARLAIES